MHNTQKNKKHPRLPTEISSWIYHEQRLCKGADEAPSLTSLQQHRPQKKKQPKPKLNPYFGSWSWRRVGHQAGDHIAVDGGASGSGRGGEPGGDDGQGQQPGAVVAVGARGAAAVGAADVIAVGAPIPAIPPGPIISFKPAVVPWHLDGGQLLLKGNARACLKD